MWETPELIKHRCRKIQAIFATNVDNKNPELVRKFVNAYLMMDQEELANTWNKGIPLLNRLLWAKLESLPDSLFNQVMDRFIDDPFLLQATAQKLNRISKLNKLLKSPVDLNERIRTIASRAVHNAFHHEAYTFAREIGDTHLIKFLVERIDELDRIMHLNIIESSENSGELSDL
ncbi:MAG TPA: hypothetical protein P5102_09750 [Candidatus Competibacteraceae bacterium]|nr:hypothetical protein [Candidatus Competibacteraceae bacterium]HRZ06418.1 hypothetical protein [Candidatus Competibacteraceae bacterium]HSA46443.1 hypothetical protein [Candidatus Competibacteraceae bacterium]